MNNRIIDLFRSKKDILSIYFTCGYPQLNDTRAVLQSLANNGADLVEIGIPFSDPIADGPTIQASNQAALDNGITLEQIFTQLEGVRAEVKIPMIMMGYLNPVMQYGIEEFCKKCAAVGIDGLILPDLPLAEYEANFKALFEKYGLINVFLITPQTSDARIRKIDSISDGFIYMVSSASTTGAKTGISNDQEAYFSRVGEMGLENPTMIGFGISNRQTYLKACKYASGAIIGSAFIKALSGKGSIDEKVGGFMKGLVGNAL